MMEDTKSHLPHYRVRPRFKIDVHLSMDDLTNKLSNALNEENALCIGKAKSGYATIYVPEKDQHYWSPQLNLTMEDNESGCTLRGLYGPRPAVWTLFVFFYSAIGFAALIILMIGLSRISLEKSGTILWLVPVFIVIIASLWLVSYYGQKLGEDQMIILHRFLEKSTGLNLDVHDQ